MINQRQDPSYYDVAYGLASASFTNGTLVIATTAGVYHGYSIVCSSAGAVYRVYDSTGTLAGNLLDLVNFSATVSDKNIRFVPVQAKKGIVVSVTLGTGCLGSVYFVPKG